MKCTITTTDLLPSVISWALSRPSGRPTRGCRCVSGVWGQLGVSAEESCLMSAEPEALPQTNPAQLSKLVNSEAVVFGCFRHTPPRERANALLRLVHGGPAPSLRRQRREGRNTGVFLSALHVSLSKAVEQKHSRRGWSWSDTLQEFRKFPS